LNFLKLQTSKFGTNPTARYSDILQISSVTSAVHCDRAVTTSTRPRWWSYIRIPLKAHGLLCLYSFLVRVVLYVGIKLAPS
jgi:hypothetical protein